MKGIILAGGTGTRLNPVTNIINKHLLPIFNKPMIYYPLSVLMLAKIKDVLIITNPSNIDSFKKLLGDGSQIGMNINYQIQEKPRGIADAFIIGEKFIQKDNVCLILGDNIFYGQYFYKSLMLAKNKKNGATIFIYRVNNPTNFSVVEFNNKKKMISITEKPKKPKSNYASTGLYFFDNSVINKAKRVKPSNRGELEITDVVNQYLDLNKLKYIFLGRGFAWLDMGSFDNLSRASEFVRTIEHQQGLMISCIEEIALRNRWIANSDLKKLSKLYLNTDYGNYLSNIADEK